MRRSTIRPVLVVALTLSLVGADRASAAPKRVKVVVAAEPGGAAAARRLVERLGGEVELRLPIVHGFTARVPAAAIARLRRADGIRAVARDVALHLSSDEPVAMIDPPPAEIPTDQPPDQVAQDVIGSAALDASAGASLTPNPLAAGEDTTLAGAEAIVDPLAPVEPAPEDAPAQARAS